jgi:hypothetical protein
MWVDNFTQIVEQKILNRVFCRIGLYSETFVLSIQYVDREREVVLKNTNSIQSMKLPDWKNEGEIIV